VTQGAGVPPTALPTDWVAWHNAYDQPESRLAQRLEIVQRHITTFLDAAPRRQLRAISICAGQGRDLLPVLGAHERGRDVATRLVELDSANVLAARRSAERHGLRQVHVVQGDAATTTAYLGAVPADLVLVCGVFGNVSESDIRQTVRLLPTLCAPGATVVWTRHRRAPDVTPSIRRWFETGGFEEVVFESPHENVGVGVHRLIGEPGSFTVGLTLFAFLR
jgi:hypothetical protein